MPPTITEDVDAIMSMNNGKVPSVDGIPSEIHMNDGTCIINTLLGCC